SFGAFSLREVQRNGDLYNQEPGYLSFTAHDQRCHLLQPMWFAEFSSRQILRELRHSVFERSPAGGASCSSARGLAKAAESGLAGSGGDLSGGSYRAVWSVLDHVWGGAN